jgi:hypothetical protein
MGYITGHNSFTSQGEREKGETEKALHDGNTSGFAGTSAMKRLGGAGRRGGSGESRWRVSPQERLKHKKTP